MLLKEVRNEGILLLPMHAEARAVLATPDILRAPFLGCFASELSDVDCGGTRKDGRIWRRLQLDRCEVVHINVLFIATGLLRSLRGVRSLRDP